jgi:hypothetical protein
MQKHKHIKYTKLSPIMSKTNTFPSGVAILSHVKKSARRRLAILSLLRFALISSLESPPSNLLKATRKPGYWSYQRFAGKELVVIREGISTPNAPYLR